MKPIFLLPLLFLVFITATFSQQKHSFEIKEGSFVYDGKPVQIHSGEMHFARVPEEYWRHRLQMIKAMGLNTVATYVAGIIMKQLPAFGILKQGIKT